VLLLHRPEAARHLLQAPQRLQGRRAAHACCGGALPLPATRRRGHRRGHSAAGRRQAAAAGGRVRPAPGRARALRRRRGRVIVDDMHRVPGESGCGGRGAAAGRVRSHLPPRLHRPVDRPRPGDVPALPVQFAPARAGRAAQPGPARQPPHAAGSLRTRRAVLSFTSSGVNYDYNRPTLTKMASEWRGTGRLAMPTGRPTSVSNSSWPNKLTRS
jgi:hypothetical protein